MIRRRGLSWRVLLRAKILLHNSYCAPINFARGRITPITAYLDEFAVFRRHILH